MQKNNQTIGKFIVFEGLDGSGQTTQATLLKLWLQQKAQRRAFYAKEPSDGPAGLIIRLILEKRIGSSHIDKPFRRIDELTLALLFAADRMDHLQNEILPALKKGFNVVADRYYLSSMAYQSLGSHYEWVKVLNSKCRPPDFTIFLDVRPEVCLQRMERQRQHVELYDDVTTLGKVRESYLRAIEDFRQRGQRIEILPGDRGVMDIHTDVVALVKTLELPARLLPGVDSATPLDLAEVKALDLQEIAGITAG